MNTLIKAGCLAIYMLAATGAHLAVPAAVLSPLQTLAIILLVLHVLELLLMFQFVKRHPGPLVDSVALTLLFGLAHWLPLKNRSPAP